MDWAQLANGIAASAAVVTAHLSFVKLGRHGATAIGVHFAQILLLVWFAAINLTLAFGVWTAEASTLIPLFRWAFAPLLATYAWRQWSAARRTIDL